ncbi:MAG: hypothetical protein JNN24_03370 [Hyphomicrobium zavarzinii]|uniref:hypothetical protein n=1 Tax=Hyphomicrobium zavarzinii TaxID=48292 RepID=UPI001A5E37AB|nr:hypothetical protein [Hyphomicrobium zavarzinii]MBL8844790.1 hypothetical protein [Hyphomicrobium zavarzinii]
MTRLPVLHAVTREVLGSLSVPTEKIQSGAKLRIAVVSAGFAYADTSDHPQPPVRTLEFECVRMQGTYCGDDMTFWALVADEHPRELRRLGGFVPLGLERAS